MSGNKKMLSELTVKRGGESLYHYNLQIWNWGMEIADGWNDANLHPQFLDLT